MAPTTGTSPRRLAPPTTRNLSHRHLARIAYRSRSRMAAGPWSTSPASTPAPATTARTRLGDFSRTSKNDPRLPPTPTPTRPTPPSGWPSRAATCDEDVGRVLTAGAERPVRRRRRPVHAAAPRPTSTRRCGSSEPGSTSSRPTATGTTTSWRRCARSSCPAARPGRRTCTSRRTVVRRAERSAWAALERYGDQPGADDGPGGVNPLTAKYLNRLSDLLFILARVANLEHRRGRPVAAGRRARARSRRRPRRTARGDGERHGGRPLGDVDVAPGRRASSQDRSAV